MVFARSNFVLEKFAQEMFIWTRSRTFEKSQALVEIKSERTSANAIHLERPEAQQYRRCFDIASEFIFTKLCSKILIPKRLDVLKDFFSLK